MKISSNKTTFATIALILLLTVTATFATLPAVNAHTPPYTIRTYAYLSVAPDPVGLGQTVFMNFFLHMPAPTVNYLRGIDVWEGLTVTVTAPDHHQTVLGPFTADATGGTYTTFVPDQLGEYSFEFKFPGQHLVTPGDWFDDYFEPSSATATLTVQQDKVEQYPAEPLPTGYWTRPIYAMNDEWARLGGNWFGYAASNFHTTGIYNASGNFAPYTQAPNSPHIIWTRPLKFGGQIGGEPWVPGDQTSHYVSTSQYQPLYGPIVIAGRLYWQERPGSSNNPTGWNCVDIKTGELIWHKNTTQNLLFGEIKDYVSINQYGAYAYLWSNRPTVAPNTGSTYGVFDAWTGEWILDIVNASSASGIGVPGVTWMVDTRTCKGSVLGYYVDTVAGQRSLVLWNSTRCILMGTRPGSGDPNSQQLNPSRGVRPWSNGIEWSAPMPTNFTGTYANGRTISLGTSKMTPDIILLSQGSAYGGFLVQAGWHVDAAMSARDGHWIWGPYNRTDKPPFTYLNSGPCNDGVYTFYDRDTFEWWGYSLTTGDKLWGPKVYPHNVWDKYGMAPIGGYGNIYAQGFGGYVNCIDIKTGDLKWTFFSGGSGYDTPYGVWVIWTFARQTLADGKFYCGEGHEYSPPTFRGAQELCIDAFTGKLLWSVLGFYAEGPVVVADGVMVTDNAYDMLLYAFAKGNTATTVSASPKVAVNGSSVLIEGTVTDQSPGQTCLGIPAAGTPAIGDLYMKPWMEYLYMQQPMPTNATGVGVQLYATGQDGAVIDIGTVTSDGMGRFEYLWTPPTTGTYKILAGFAGSNSYYASSAETSLGVSAAPPAPAPAAEAVAPDYTPMFAGIIAAVVVVAVLVVYTLLTVRKLKK